VAIVFLVHAGGEHRRRKVGPHAATEIVKSQRHSSVTARIPNF
jgi:hypothetical protein